jgi:hypothetical protein
MLNRWPAGTQNNPRTNRESGDGHMTTQDREPGWWAEIPAMSDIDRITALSVADSHRLALHLREHYPAAAADADARSTPEGFRHHGTPGWLAYVAQDNPAAFDAALTDMQVQS